MPFAAQRLSDINPSLADAQISELTVFNDKLYFSATDGVGGSELWVYDGINAPEQVVDLNPGAVGSDPGGLIVFQDRLIFSATDVSGDRQLWSYDGSNPPQVLSGVSTAVGASAQNDDLRIFQGKLLFNADNDGAYPPEVWSYDGINSPSPFTELGPELSGIYLNEGGVFQDQLYFIEPSPGPQTLWSYDGTNPPVQVSDYGRDGVNPRQVLAQFQNKLYFTDFGASGKGPDLWVYDGNSIAKVADTLTNNVDIGTNPEDLTVFGDDLYFLTTDSDGAINLWSYWFQDGEPVAEFIAEVRRANSNYRPSYLTAFDGKLYFRADGQTDDNELWVYDGTNPPVLVADINPGAAASDIRELTVFQDQLFFTADDGTTGRELWSHGAPAPGDINPNFGTGSSGLTDFGQAEGARNIIQLPDGKFVVVGTQTGGRGLDWAIARYLPDGTLDESFAGFNAEAGKVTTPVPNPPNPNAVNLTVFVAAQADGKLIVAGQNTIIRYNSDGSTDETFGVDGRISNSINILNLAVQADDQIIVSGSTSPDSTLSVAALRRYGANGQIDLSFGDNGTVTTNVEPTVDFVDSANHGLTVQPDGKIIAVGSTSAPENFYNISAIRYNTDGSLDETFGTGGVVTTALSDDFDAARSVVVQPDGKIVIGGYAQGLTAGSFALVRYDADGSLDESFGEGGSALTIIDETNRRFRVEIALQPDGKIVLVGSTAEDVPEIQDTFADYGLAIARFNADGSPDLSFGNQGVVQTNPTDRIDAAYDLVITPEGNIVVAGESDGDFLLTSYVGGEGAGALPEPEPEPEIDAWTNAVASPLLKSAREIQVDSDSNVYAIVPTIAVTEPGDYSIDVIKVAADGTQLWSQTITRANADVTDNLLIGKDGQVYLYGDFLEGGISIAEQSLANDDGGYDSYAAKLNPDGSLGWLQGIQSPASDFRLRAQLDPAGNELYVANRFSEEITVAGQTLVENDISTRLRSDIFLAKLNAQGEALWTQQLASDRSDGLASLGFDRYLTVDREGRLYVSGRFSHNRFDETQFSLGNSEQSLLVPASLPSQDIGYIAQFERNGALAWAEKFSGIRGYSVDPPLFDGLGNSYVTGRFNPGEFKVGDRTLFTAEREGDFVAKFTPDGEIAWVKRFQKEGISTPLIKMQVDQNGGLYVTATFNRDSISIDGESIARSSESGSYIARFNADGSLDWLEDLNSVNSAFYAELLQRQDGGVILVSDFENDASAPLQNESLVSRGDKDIYIASFDLNGDLDWVQTVGSASDDTSSLAGLDGDRIYPYSQSLNVASDSEGNWIVSGLYRDAVLNVGAKTLARPDTESAYLAKIDGETGDTEWLLNQGQRRQALNLEFQPEFAQLEPTVPQDPIEPQQPTDEPQQPIDPEAPEEPTDPQEPQEPSEPQEPTNPLPPQEQKPHIAPNDWNGDGRTDFVYQDAETGALRLAFLGPPISEQDERPLVIYQAVLAPALRDRNWQIQGLGYFNKDDWPYLLWRNELTGQNVIWTFQGTAVNEAITLPHMSDRNWAIKGIHDIDGDGASDLLWFNQTDGKAAVWYMDGSDVRERVNLDVSGINPGDKLAATGDFDGNGSLDLLWYPGQGIEYKVWLMDGLTIQSQNNVIADPSLDLGGTWKVLGSGDYSGSGVDDLLWQNVDTGETQAWRIIDGISTYQQTLPWPPANG